MDGEIALISGKRGPTEEGCVRVRRYGSKQRTQSVEQQFLLPGWDCLKTPWHVHSVEKPELLVVRRLERVRQRCFFGAATAEALAYSCNRLAGNIASDKQSRRDELYAYLLWLVLGWCTIVLLRHCATSPYYGCAESLATARRVQVRCPLCRFSTCLVLYCQAV